MAGRPRSTAIKVSTTTTRSITLPKILQGADPWPDALSFTLTKRGEGDYVLVPEGQALETV